MNGGKQAQVLGRSSGGGGRGGNDSSGLALLVEL